MNRWAGYVAALVALSGLAYGLWRVGELERRELEYTSEWQPLEPTPDPEGRPTPHMELGRVALQQGEEVGFELCARDQLEPSRWAGQFELALWLPESQHVVLRQPLDQRVLEGVTRSPEGACVSIAQGGDLRLGGDYAVEAIWPEGELSPEVRGVPLMLRVTAFAPLSPSDRWPAILVLTGAFLLIIILGRRPLATFDPKLEDRSSSLPPPEASKDLLRLALGLLCLVGAVLGVAFIPIPGTMGGLTRAVVLALVQLLAAVLLIAPLRGGWGGRLEALGLASPKQGAWVLGLASVVGIALWLAGQLALRLVPSTGESAMGLLVAWPSGALAVALASVAAPVVEELFFRGFLFGTLERLWGGTVAFGVTVLIFALLHLPQTWGVWGGIVSILITSLGLTALRWWTGSVTAPALAHLTHNGAIILLAASMR